MIRDDNFNPAPEKSIEQIADDLHDVLVTPGTVILFTHFTEHSGMTGANREFHGSREPIAAVYNRGEWHLTEPIAPRIILDAEPRRVIGHYDFMRLLANKDRARNVRYVSGTTEFPR